MPSIGGQDNYDPDEDDDDGFYQVWYEAVCDDIETDRLIVNVLRN